MSHEVDSITVTKISRNRREVITIAVNEIMDIKAGSFTCIRVEGGRHYVQESIEEIERQILDLLG